MSLSKTEHGTISCYDQTAENFQNFRNPDYWQKELALFNELLPSGKIVEIGCGTGIEAKKLVSAGYDYVGLDASLSMLKIAKNNLPEGQFLCEDLKDLSLKEKFDGFLAIASLLHLSKNDMSPTLTNLKLHLQPQALGLIVMKDGEGEIVKDNGLFFNYYHAIDFFDVLNKVGFTTEHLEIRPDRNHDYLCFFVRNT